MDFESKIPGHVHEVFGVEDGLPRAGINDALQTGDGYIWFATFDGLARFDGTRFEVFNSERVPALGSNRIHRLTETSNGTLWILSEQGHLTRFANGLFTACEVPRDGRATCGLAEGGAWYHHVEEDPSGVIWVGGKEALFKFENEVLIEETSVENPGRIRSIYPDRSGHLWVGADRGLWVGRAGRFSVVELGFQVTSMAEDRAGVLWVGTNDAVGRLVEGRLRREFGEIGWVICDAAGVVWVSLLHRLYRLHGNRPEQVLTSPRGRAYLLAATERLDSTGAAWVTWSDYLLRDEKPVLRSEFAWGAGLLVDRDGTVWSAAGRPGELHAFHPERLRTFYLGLPALSLSTVFEDTDGTLRVGGSGFLASLGPGTDVFVAQAVPGIPRTGEPRQVRSLLRDNAGTLWVGLSQGLFTKEGDRFLGPHLLPPADIPALLEDREGALWVGSSLGLAYRAPWTEEWTPARPQGEVEAIKARVIHEGPDGRLWFGTNGRGVFLYEKKTHLFTQIARSQGLSSDLVRSLWTAPDGRLWVGTENRGLNRLNPDSVSASPGPIIDIVDRKLGLPSAGIHQMLEDGLGNLWMSTNDGVLRAKIADLNAVADGRLPRLETVVYDERDGMRNREANGGVQSAGLKDRQERLWFPTQEGLVRIDPVKLLEPADPPPVHIEKVWVGETVVSRQNDRVRLEPAQRSFRITWTAPFFRAPDRLRFRYRLQGYDGEWVEAANRREAFFTQVPPGRYDFQVAVALEGLWSDARGEPPASLKLEVIPRFYETRGFLLAAFLTGLLLLILVFVLWDRRRQARQRARERLLEATVQQRTATIREQAERLLEMDRLRAQFFANVSHEFRTPLTLILGPVRDAQRGDFGAVGRLPSSQITLIEENAERLLDLVDQLLRIAQLDAGKFSLKLRRLDLVKHLHQRVEGIFPMAERLGVHLETHLPTRPLPWTFDPAELAKVFDNLLSNALRFSHSGGTVRVSLAVTEENVSHRAVRVSVQDDGPGIAADQLERIFERFQQGTGRNLKPGFGLGLALARQLTEFHGGRLTVNSPPEPPGPSGQGACFVVNLPDQPADEGTLLDAHAPKAQDLRLIEPGDSGPTPEPSDAETDGERATLLVVDDNADIRAYLRRHLEPRYAVAEAADGIEALKKARRTLPDLVISDIMMPGLDGKDLARSLRRDARLMLVPVILVTAKASGESRLAALREGVDDYLIKPFDPRELLARVENLLTIRRRLLNHIRPPRSPLRVSEIEITSADEAFLVRVRRLVEEHLGNPGLTVASLAVQMGCDRSYLLRKLRLLTGETPSELIRSFRLQRAEQLLRARAGAVTDVAYAVGFKTVPHFSNAFLERFGERPSVFLDRLSLEG